MTELDGELSPPFVIVEPAAWRAPIIFNSPHSGSVYPDEFLTASRIDLGAHAGEIGAARTRSFRSYGSCSFDEPVADLTALGILERQEA